MGYNGPWEIHCLTGEEPTTVAIISVVKQFYCVSVERPDCNFKRLQRFDLFRIKWLMMVVVISVVVYARIAYEKLENYMLVYTEQGPIKGYKAIEGDFFVFYGVPYATAPTGRDRYKAPLPPTVWTEPLEAIDKGIVCPQRDYWQMDLVNKTTHEDCLIATIYVPDNHEYNIPVVVYVHGGGYLFAFGDYVTPRNFAKTKRVILVTFNYRLGAHGFLCLGTKDVPGNAAMKDQVALLRWVKKNIANFRGNPDDITLAGYSAGSAAVDLLMISKMTKGLFNRVIPESGASIAAFNMQFDPIENAKRVARLLNFTNVDDLEALEEFYMTASYEKLNSIDLINVLDSNLYWCPCVESDIGEERFLEDSPLNILSSGDYPKLPLLYGFTTLEGLLRLSLFEEWKDQMNENFSDFLPADLKFDSEEKKQQVALEIKKFYFGENGVSPENILAYVDYFSDVLVIYATLRAVNLHLEAGHDKIYFYEYVHVDEDTIKIPYTNVRGPDHCAQTWAVLDGLNLTHTNEILISNNLRNMKNVTRELWLNFMTTGNPVPDGSPFPKWPTTGRNGVPHMALDTKLELRDYFERNLEKRYRFWDKLYKKYSRMPVTPRVHQKTFLTSESETSNRRGALRFSLITFLMSLILSI